MQASDFPVIAVTSGMSGHFAVHYWWNPEGFPEPYNTGFGRYATELEAALEAHHWAEDEGIRLCPSVTKLLADNGALPAKAMTINELAIAYCVAHGVKSVDRNTLLNWRP